LERVWIEAISLLMLSRAAVKTLGTRTMQSAFVSGVNLGHIILRSADGVECALERMAWVERSIHDGQIIFFDLKSVAQSYFASQESGRSRE
jgi:hypothetical protein